MAEVRSLTSTSEPTTANNKGHQIQGTRSSLRISVEPSLLSVARPRLAVTERDSESGSAFSAVLADL